MARSHRLEQQIGQLLEQLAALTQRVAELTERLGQIRETRTCRRRAIRRAALGRVAAGGPRVVARGVASAATADRRQICWAHLPRKFVAFSERAGPSAELGRQLLDYTGLLFDYWHDYKAGKLDRATFRAWMAPVRAQVEAVLERAVASDINHLAGSCANILEHRVALWTFIDVHGVEPTNNHAERELRAFVLWRRRSFGTQSERGNRFAERLMTIAHTARKQHKDVLPFLAACCQARDPEHERRWVVLLDATWTRSIA